MNIGLGQGAFPTKPSEVPVEGVKPLVDPTGQDDPNAPQPAATPPPIADPKAKPVVKASKSTAPISATDRPSAVPEYVIDSGDSLTKVSAQAYGRAGYWRVLKLYNECDPAKLKIGQVIQAPDLGWLLEEEGIVPLLKDAADSMMEGRKLFMEVEDAMHAEGLSTPNDEMKTKIVEAQKLITKSRTLFADKRDGVSGLPNSTLLQLRTAGELMGKVAKGSRVRTNATQVHERFGNAITYGVLWAREGFK
jgi:LysM repeat protein